MYSRHYALTLLSLCIAGSIADFLGPTYPAPVDLTSDDSLVSKGWKNLTSTFEGYLKGNQTPTSGLLFGVENVTFSFGLFSIHDPAAKKLQYHYTSPEVANAPNGTHKVDGDSIYRVASVSKLITVFAGMLTLTHDEWNSPITSCIPGLAEYAREHLGEKDPVYTTQWAKITPWALASQLAGVAHLGWPAGDALYEYEALAAVDKAAASALNPVALGFPPEDLSILGPCSDLKKPLCATDHFIKSISILPPSFLPWTSPGYSNLGFMLLGLAISNFTGKAMDTVYRESIFEPLGMTSSNSTPPTGKGEFARSVIADFAEFASDGGFTTPSGGMFSTINDLARFGTGLLNSTLLPSNETRKWMKPITHTASLTYSVGAPWEIARYIHPSTGKVTDIYTKIGDSGSYGGLTALIPDYGAGFSMLSGHSNATIRSKSAISLIDLVIEAVLPALEAQAAVEATRNFVGTYVSTNGDLNSSLTIAFNESTVKGTSPGLIIDSWISNGTDALALMGMKARLLPSIPNQSSSGAGGQVAFQASTRPQTNSYTAAVAEGLAIGPFTGQYGANIDWLLVDEAHYAGRSVYLFVFDVDEEGRATKVSPAVTRATLVRKQ